jgi:hypothetical protein
MLKVNLNFQSPIIPSNIENRNQEAMDSSGILSLLEQFDDDLDDLEESIEPLFKSSLSATSSKLPLLDKAKLYILATYAIESLLFCGLPSLIVCFDAG